MQSLLRCVPPQHDQVNDLGVNEDDANPYRRNRMLSDALQQLAEATDRYCALAAGQQAERERLFTQGERDHFPASLVDAQPGLKHALTKVYDEWVQYYVENMADMRAVQDLKLADGRAYSYTRGSEVFYQLSRLMWLLAQPKVALEWENTHLIDPSGLDPLAYDCLFALSHAKSDTWKAIVTALETEQPGEGTETYDAEHNVMARELRQRVQQVWRKPISQYTCSETRILAAFLTERMNEVAERDMAEYRRVFAVLWLRCAELCILDNAEEQWPVTLDEEDMRVVRTDVAREPTAPKRALGNRRYYVFCSAYLGEVMRRLFHYDALAPNRLLLGVQLPSVEMLGRLRERNLAWVTEMVESFAEEAFEDMYMSVVRDDEGGYAFPGDDTWFRFAFPTNVLNRGSCITQLRPHLYSRYYSEANLDRRLVLKKYDRSHMVRLFVFRAIDEHIKLTHPVVEFINGVVVDNAGIEQAEHVLTGMHAPVLIQVFAAYWVYHQGQVYPTDDLFESLALWWWLLREHYESKLYGVDLSDFMQHTLEPRPIAREEGDFEMPDAEERRVRERLQVFEL